MLHTLLHNLTLLSALYTLSVGGSDAVALVLD